MEILPSHEKILKILRRRQLTISEIAEELGGRYAEGSIRGRISDLKKSGYEIKSNRVNGHMTYYAPTRPAINAKQTIVKSSGTGHFKIAIISDTHLASVTEDLTSAFDDLIKSIGINNLNVGKRDGDEYNRFLNIKMIGGHFYGERIHMYVTKNKVFKFHYSADCKRKKLFEKEYKDYHFAKKEFEKLIYKERMHIINELYNNEN